MSTNVTAIKSSTKAAPGPRSPEREALARAIAANGEAKRAEELGHQAVVRASQLVAENEAKVAAAAAAVVDARAQQASRVVEAVAAGRAAPPSTTRAARDAERECEDELESARAALEKLSATLVKLEESARRADLNVQAAVNAVLACEAAPLIEKLENLKTEAPRLQAALNFIRNRGSVARGSFREEVRELAEPLRAVAPKITQAIEVGLSFNPLSAEQHPVAEQWRSTCEALGRDADAALPAA